ncbi:uncharacterized protein KQ657_003050 [Scheffersomyces spartinae]|uniref:Uncharacterized protein n=1 Tax=Scheffersomyces spartinae TaxID=45513 RepID=A0A9P8AGL7_9ASCO|nr:uncharacterized protein KQ657_003050 [Scheffersomyces spartinae]KAG7191545.1 hypothetical protein KQ657_003050 [Scheffersomyces spartinae]
MSSESNGTVIPAAASPASPTFTLKTWSHLKSYQALQQLYVFITSLSIVTYLSAQLSLVFNQVVSSKYYKSIATKLPPVPTTVVTIANGADEIFDSLLITFDGLVAKLLPYTPTALYSKLIAYIATNFVAPANTFLAKNADAVIGGTTLSTSAECKEHPDALATLVYILATLAKTLRLTLWSTSTTLSTQVHETYTSERENVTEGSLIQKNITASYNTANILAKDLNSKFIQPSLEQTKGLVTGVASSTKQKADTLIQDAKSTLVNNDFVVKVTSVAGSAVDTIAKTTKPATDAVSEVAGVVGEATKPVVAEVISPVMEQKPPLFTASA